jgi:hypothetical protein
MGNRYRSQAARHETKREAGGACYYRVAGFAGAASAGVGVVAETDKRMKTARFAKQAIEQNCRNVARKLW